MVPSSLIVARSPVGKNPSAVRSGGRGAPSRAYPTNNDGPRTWALPTSPSGTGRPSVSTTLTSVPGNGRPSRPRRMSAGSDGSGVVWPRHSDIPKTRRNRVPRWRSAFSRARAFIGPPPTVIAVSDDSAPSEPATRESWRAIVGTSIVQRTWRSRRSATASSALHLSRQTIGLPSMAGRCMPKQKAATLDNGTRAPTGSPGCRPTASMVA